MMQWKKIKHVEVPASDHSFMQSHLANAVVKLVDDNIWRIYCNTRDAQNRSYVIYIDIDPSNNFKVINVADKPLLELGPIGAFDDNGMSLGCIHSTNEHDYLYYLGWNLAANVPFRNAIGLAISPRGKNQFQKVSVGPIMDRDIVDPFSLSYPFVIEDNGVYKMWYGSHKQWGETTDDMIHCLKYAESKDLINWNRTDTICIDTTNTDYAFSRPFVIKDKDVYRMWYSFRGKKYRIGYAESQDGLNWQRMDDQAGITVSDSGWDSEMVEYPCVFEYNNDTYMLYNGNKYGATGLGVAILQR